MKAANNLMARTQAFAQAFLLLCVYACSPIALAASKTDLDYADLNQLARLETTIFGSAHKNLPNEKRVDSLEKILFGKTHGGPLHSRIFAIASTLTGSGENTLSPPLAPGLDREDSVKNAPASSVTENHWQKDQGDVEPPSEAKHERINSSLQEAMKLYSQGQTSQAETVFKNVLSLDSKNADANFNLGAIAESRADWQNALHYYQTALGSNPDDQETKSAVESMKSKLASSMHQQQTPSKANKLSAKQLDLLRAKVNQAANDYAKGNYDSAISNLKTVLTEAPDQADVYYALGQAYKAKNEKSEAANAFSEAAKLAPDNKQYADALSEIAPDRGTDTFSSNNPDLNNGPAKHKPGNNNLANKENNDWTPDTPGEITPFSDQGNNQGNNSELGWQPAGTPNGSYAPSYSPGMTSAYMPAYTYSNYIPYSMTTMMERAAFGSLAGAAIGSMLSPPGYRTRGAFTGGMFGGMMGAMGGRHRW